MIPEILHFIWYGDMPPEVEEVVSRWKALLPDWDVKVWKTAPLYNRAAWERTDILSERSDIMRYELMYRFGGFYLDCDMHPCRPIPPTARLLPGYLSHNGLGNFATAVLAFEPGHPFMAAAVEGIQHSHEHTFGHVAYPHRTGPRYLTRLYERYKHANLPVPATYPTHWFFSVTAEFRKAPPHPDAIAVHRFAHSWKGQK